MGTKGTLSNEDESARMQLRAEYRKKRDNLSAKEQTASALNLVAQFKQQDIYKGAKHIAVYLSNDGELETTALLEYLWDKQLNVYIPVLNPNKNGHLLFLHYIPTTAMTKNRFGIREPVLDEQMVTSPSSLDIIFTPLVAFDLKGNRLGMGGGYYDRTLASLSNKTPKKPKIVGLAHDFQQSNSISTASWDVPIDYVQTPSQLHDFTISKQEINT